MWAYTTENPTTVKFLYYVLKNNIQRFRDAASGMGALPQISLPVTEEFVMPVPPIEVQEEIIRILDNFTELTSELTSELTTELTARKKQYEYYKSQLFDFDNVSVEMKPIGDKFSFIRNGFVGTATPYYTSKDKGVRYLKGTNIHNGVISDNEEEYIITQIW